MSTDRRRSPRVAIVGQIQGRSVSFDAPIRVRDFSIGGMALETEYPLPVGAVEQFLVTLGDGAALELRGRVVRCRNLAGDGEPPLYASGIQFVDDDAADGSAAAEDVIDKLR